MAPSEASRRSLREQTTSVVRGVGDLRNEVVDVPLAVADHRPVLRSCEPLRRLARGGEPPKGLLGLNRKRRIVPGVLVRLPPGSVVEFERCQPERHARRLINHEGRMDEEADLVLGRDGTEVRITGAESPGVTGEVDLGSVLDNEHAAGGVLKRAADGFDESV